MNSPDLAPNMKPLLDKASELYAYTKNLEMMNSEMIFPIVVGNKPAKQQQQQTTAAYHHYQQQKLQQQQ